MVWFHLIDFKRGLLASLIIAVSPAISALADDKISDQNKRLPGDVLPSAYTLYFDPKPESKSFSGEETIEIQVLNATRKIVLNAVMSVLLKQTINPQPRPHRKNSPLVMTLNCKRLS